MQRCFRKWFWDSRTAQLLTWAPETQLSQSEARKPRAVENGRERDLSKARWSISLKHKQLKSFDGFSHKFKAKPPGS